MFFSTLDTPGAESDGAISAPENLLSPTLTRPYFLRRGSGGFIF